MALMQEADKLTLGQGIHIPVPCAVTALTNGQGHRWLPSSRMAQHQGQLCENPPGVRLKTLQTLSPTPFLPAEEGPPGYSREEVTKLTPADPT